VLFPLLAADLSLQELSPLGIGGVACVLALMLWRGPVMQLAGLGLPSLGWRQRLIISWIAPRGIVSEPPGVPLRTWPARAPPPAGHWRSP
jgi:NhaP-type Na+/H+ or K+/H+ antiporter